MTTLSDCPRCGTTLAGSTTDCASCGWTKRSWRSESAAQQAGPDPLRLQCAWEADGLRCRYPGSAGHSTNGSGPLYCRGHIYCDNPDHGARIVHESQSYRPDDGSHFHNQVAASLRRFGMEREPGESAEAYALRMRDFCRAGLRNLLGRQHGMVKVGD